ncbi:hypothetical protein BMS3Abin10_01068 [bacterium BMS3Abin10]|nr:hypothetical protein BMS3Abin10_01068 [bacterium BMS3Abin10]GBE38030.1 hypothetical protein BMS3Bbin08_00629 [bacterium BMS3Bbin08]
MSMPNGALNSPLPDPFPPKENTKPPLLSKTLILLLTPSTTYMDPSGETATSLGWLKLCFISNRCLTFVSLIVSRDCQRYEEKQKNRDKA